MKINKLLESKKIKESNETETLWKKGNQSIIKDGYGFGIDNGYNVNRFTIDNDGTVRYDYAPSKTMRTIVDRLVRQGKFNNPHYSDNAKYVGNTLKYGRGIEESFKPSDSGIQSVKCYNRYNYTIQELRVDNDNKTFERGNFTAGKADKKTHNRQEFEDIVDSLIKLGYTEIKSDYKSMRNKTRKGMDTNESVDFSSYEKSVENFLNKYGFNDERYPHIINSYNNTEETVVKVSFNDGISAKDFGVMKKHLGTLGADIYLANRHKDYSKDNELWSTIEFEFNNATKRESLKESNEKPLTFDEFQEFAMKHYNSGGDGVVECWDEQAFDGYVKEFGPITRKVALSIFRMYNSTYGDIRGYADLDESKYVTRYAVEYYFDDDENKDVEYVYADSASEARDVVKNKYPGCVITGCDSSEVPADYKKWDMNESKSLKETYWIDNKEVMNEVDRLSNELEADGWAYRDSKYTGSNYYVIFVKRTNNKPECKAIVYNHDYQPEVIDITAEQAAGYEPLDSFDGMRRKLGKMLLPQRESKSVKTFGAKAKKLNESTSEDWDSDRVTELVDYYMKRANHDHRFLTQLVLNSMKEEGRKMPYNIADFYAKVDKEYYKHTKGLEESSEGFQKEFYNGYVILKNRAGDGWDIYSYDGTPEKVKKAYLEDEGFATLKDAKAEIDKWIEESKLDEASYGGAFDIADDEFWTRDDINDFADEVIDNINEIFYKKYKVIGSWFENGSVIVSIGDDDGNEYEASQKVDMRKIRKPSDLVKYIGEIVYDLRQQIEKLEEDISVSSRYEFDDDTDELTYYYDDEVFNDNLENSPYTEIASKQVPDSDGFMTDYTMYMNINTGEYVFVFGDKDVYTPEDGYFDWECETKEEAEEWFNSYKGLTDEDDDDSLNWMNEDANTTSPIVHKKGDGSYLVASDSGDGYTAFNKSDVCVGHISATSEQEAKTKFNMNKFDENLTK